MINELYPVLLLNLLLYCGFLRGEWRRLAGLWRGGGVEQVINIFGVFVEHFLGYVSKNALLCRK